MKAQKILITAICLFMACLNLKAQIICTTPAPPPPAWIFNPTTRTNNGMTPPYTMRVFVHIVRSSDGTGLSSSIVSSMITKLNADYASAQIKFQSAGFDFIDNDAFYDELAKSEYPSLFSTNRQTNAINIYVLGASTVTGVVGHAENIPSTALWIRGDFCQTPVLTHEMGHCLGLYHTHHGTVYEEGDPGQCEELVDGSNGEYCGDYIADTPADPNWWNGCNYDGRNLTQYNPDPTNYMSYAGADNGFICWTNFTPGQKQRMLDFIENTLILQNVVMSIIEGSYNMVCYSGASFSLHNAPLDDITWTLPSGGAFSFSHISANYSKTTSGNNHTLTVYRIGFNNDDATLTVKDNSGTTLAERPLTACPAPTISGPGEVCYGGSQFMLNASPTGAIVNWTSSNPGIITVSPATTTGNYHQVTATRVGVAYGNVTLTASMNGIPVATKIIGPCGAPSISGASSTVCYSGSSFSLTPNPGVTVYWTSSNPSIITVSPASTTGNHQVTATRIGVGTGNVTLTASVNGVNVTKTITPCVPAITGSGTVYYTGNQFTLQNPPPGVVSWSSSNPGIITIGSSGNPVTAYRVGYTPGSGSITLTASVGGYSFTTNVQACSPQMPITGPSYVSCGDLVEYTMPYVAGATYQWSSNILNLSWTAGGGSTAYFFAPYYNYDWASGDLFCDVLINGQMMRSSMYVYYECYSPSFIFYPNPASGMVNIEIDTERYENASNARGVKIEPTYDIRLYDGMGNLVRNTTTKSDKMQLNVSGLPNGTYYLHVYDGISGKPEIKQIVVQH